MLERIQTQSISCAYVISSQLCTILKHLTTGRCVRDVVLYKLPITSQKSDYGQVGLSASN